MSNEISTQVAGNPFAVSDFDKAVRLATAMASAKMVPQHLQGSAGDCLMVIEQAMRWQMSPFAVAQSTAVVRGKMCFEGKLVAAAIQTSGVLNGRLHYTYSGEGDSRRITVSGHVRGEELPRTIEVALRDAQTDNQWWKKTPDQMLAYHGARVWARRHTPEVMLGVYSPDEFDEAPVHTQNITTIESESRHVQRTERDTPTKVDHIAFWRDRLTRVNDAGSCDAQWGRWDEAIQKAEAAGSPISAETAQAVFDMIAERRGQFHGVSEHEASDLEVMA